MAAQSTQVGLGGCGLGGFCCRGAYFGGGLAAAPAGEGGGAAGVRGAAVGGRAGDGAGDAAGGGVAAGDGSEDTAVVGAVVETGLSRGRVRKRENATSVIAATTAPPPATSHSVRTRRTGTAGCSTADGAKTALASVSGVGRSEAIAGNGAGDTGADSDAPTTPVLAEPSECVGAAGGCGTSGRIICSVACIG